MRKFENAQGIRKCENAKMRECENKAPPKGTPKASPKAPKRRPFCPLSPRQNHCFCLGKAMISHFRDPKRRPKRASKRRPKGALLGTQTAPFWIPKSFRKRCQQNQPSPWSETGRPPDRLKSRKYHKTYGFFDSLQVRQSRSRSAPGLPKALERDTKTSPKAL